MTQRSRQQALRRIPPIVLLVSVLAIAGLAFLNRGVATADVDVNDGGVWVTNGEKSLVGHLSFQAHTIDAAFRVKAAQFNIGQAGNTVTYTDDTAHSVSSVDVANVRLGAAVTLPEKAIATQGGDRMAVLDQDSGNVWTGEAARPSGTSFIDGTAPVTDMPGGVVAVGPDGTAAAVSADASRFSVIKRRGYVDTVANTPIAGLSPAADLSVTLVGDQPVALDSLTNTLILPNGRLLELTPLGVASGGVLQQPGAAADHVLIATGAALVSVALDGSAATPLPAADGAATPGLPAAPVRLNGCEYAAWGKSGAYLRRCDGAPSVDRMSVDTLKAATRVVFRTNRDIIVLNDIDSGNVWLPQQNMVLATGWDQIDTQLKQDDKQQESPQTTQKVTDPDRKKQNRPPQAHDDEFGVRPGRVTTLDVLNNDSDPDGDVLTAVPLGNPRIGTIVQARGGRALQIDMPDGATGSATFQYNAFDGQAVDPATVKVAVHPWAQNLAPRQLRSDPGLIVGSHATVSYNVLPDWRDPDGDPIFLKSANTDPASRVTVTYREEGTITIHEVGAAPGPVRIDVEVSDGKSSASGVLIAHVQRPGNLPPVANGDFQVARVDELLTLQPLANDTDPNGDELHLKGARLAADSAATASIQPDLDLGTIDFRARSTGPHFVTYTVSDGTAEQVGLIRVDVIKAKQSAMPVAEDDLVLLPEGGSTLAAPLDNDSDPAGGVLVVQSVDVPKSLGLNVVLIDHHLLRITADGALTASTSFAYTVSNGQNTATARVMVVPTNGQNRTQPPVLQPDHVTVRAGDVGAVNVLDNDRSPAGLAMTVLPALGFDSDQAVGKPFVNGDQVRLEAGANPGTMNVVYTVQDSAGNVASAKVTFDVVATGGTNSAPQPEPLTAWAVAGQIVRIPVPLTGIDPDGDSVTLVGIQQPPQLGAVKLGIDWLEYTPTAAARGTDAFTYIVEDRLGKQATATVRVGIAAPSDVNQPPRAVPDAVTARPNRSLVVPVLANDSDPDGDQVELAAGSVSCDDPRVHPVVASANVALTTPPDPGVYLITYQVTDGRGGVADGLLTVTVTEDASLRAPVARDDVVALADVPTDGSPVTVDVLTNDEDPDGDTGALAITCDRLCTVTPDRKIKITPDAMRVLVVYTITDVDGLTGTAVVSVPGTSQMQPRINPAKVPYAMRADQTTTIDLNDFVITRAGRTPHLTQADRVIGSVGIEAAMDGDASIKLTVDKDFVGATSVSFEVRDGAVEDRAALSATLTLPVEVASALNHPPVLTPTQVSVEAGGPAVRVDLATWTRDPDGQDPAAFTYKVTSAPASISVHQDGRLIELSTGADTHKGPAGDVRVTVDDGFGPVDARIPVLVVSSRKPLIQLSEISLTLDAGKSTRVDLADYAKNPFPGEPMTLVTKGLTGGHVKVVPEKLVVVITPESGFVGATSVPFALRDATGDDDRIVNGRIDIIVRDRPDPPTGVSASVKTATSATVTFTAGSNNGAPITGFTVTADPGGKHADCGVATACDVTGLTAGTYYNFTVTATNVVGTSDPSAPMSEKLLVDEIPNPPTNVKADPGDGFVAVSWDAPGGAASLKEYHVALSNGQSKVVADATSCQLTAKNGDKVSATVSAVNAMGASAAAKSAEVVPYGKPVAPAIKVTLMPPPEGATGASVEVLLNLSPWSTANDNGRPVTNVVIASAADAGPKYYEGSPKAGDIYTIDGLAAGVAMKLSVTVTTEGGTANAVSDSFTPRALPLAPPLEGLTLQATGKSGQVAVGHLLKAVGNGFELKDLKFEYQVNDGAWEDLAPQCSNGVCQATIGNLPDGEDVILSFRQVSTIGTTAVQGPSTSAAPVRPYGQVTVEGFTARWTPTGVDVDIAVTGHGQSVAAATLSWPGGAPLDVLVDIGTTKHYTFAEVFGSASTKKLTLTAVGATDNKPASNSVTLTRGTPTIGTIACPTETPASPDATPSPSPNPGPAPYCQVIMLAPGDWTPNVGKVDCVYSGAGNAEKVMGLNEGGRQQTTSIKSESAARTDQLKDATMWTCTPAG